MTITKREVQPKARITYDEMEAFLTLPVPKEGEEYTLEELLALLEKNQIRHGIEQETLRKMLRERIYNKEVCIAVGTPVVDGIDGHFDYHFNNNFSKKPKIRPDGSVDYWSINMVEPVEKGQVIAIYKPPVPGEDGMTVKGRPLPAKRARELPPLKGRGFTRQEDGNTYTSNMDGKIDMENDRITISQVYEIFGNADLSVGNINFVGDVVVHGNVTAGASVRATGTVTIDGVVESADITADGDIVLRSGMLGGSKAVLTTKANLYAKFVEYAKVDVRGSIEADAFVGCEITCGDEIVLNGKKSRIIGGKVFAVRGIEALVLGSPGEVATSIRVGVREEVLHQIKELEKKVETHQENITKIEAGLANFERLGKERGIDYKDDPRRTELLRVKIQEIAAMAAEKTELEGLQREVEEAQNASVKAQKAVYPGVSIGIDELKISVQDMQERVQFVKSVDKILMMRMEE